MIQELTHRAEWGRRDQKSPFDQGRRRSCDGKPKRKGTVVVPIDLGSTCTGALDYAISHARRANSRVLVVHVVERHYAEGFIEKTDRDRLQEQAAHAAESKLKELIESRSCEDVPITFELRRGLPEYEILKAAENANADMIIIGRENRGALRRIIFGSVAENLLDASPIPVLVIPYSR